MDGPDLIGLAAVDLGIRRAIGIGITSLVERPAAIDLVELWLPEVTEGLTAEL